MTLQQFYTNLAYYVKPESVFIFDMDGTLVNSDIAKWQPTRPRRPWDSPGKNTAVGCHFLLQCMKVKSESEVAQSWLTLSDPMDCSLPGSSIHGICQARVLEWGAIAFSQSCPTLCDPMDCSMPAFSVLHYLPEFVQIDIH